MELANDFADFVDLLNRYDVRYMIVGGYAVMAHGHPRFTEDFDIWIKPTPENAEKIIVVLKDFGFVLKGLTKSDFEREDVVIQLGYPPLRIDLMSSISGVSFDDAYANHVLKKLGSSQMHFIGLRDLIKNKEATGREKDLLDAKQLNKLIINRNK